MANNIEIGLVGYGYWGKNLARNFAKDITVKQKLDKIKRFFIIFKVMMNE